MLFDPTLIRLYEIRQAVVVVVVNDDDCVWIGMLLLVVDILVVITVLRRPILANKPVEMDIPILFQETDGCSKIVAVVVVVVLFLVVFRKRWNVRRMRLNLCHRHHHHCHFPNDVVDYNVFLEGYDTVREWGIAWLLVRSFSGQAAAVVVGNGFVFASCV